MFEENKYNLFLGIIKKTNLLFHKSHPEVSSEDVVEWDVSASQIKKGDSLVIYGSTKPENSVKIDVDFNIKIPIEDGTYKHHFDDVPINSIPNEFVVKAYNVKNMTFTVKMLIPFNQYREAVDGIATYVDKDVPAGDYDIVIKAEASEELEVVSLDVKASQTITSDNKENFVYEYPTNPFPNDIISISLGKDKKEIEIVSLKERIL